MLLFIVHYVFNSGETLIVIHLEYGHFVLRLLFLKVTLRKGYISIIRVAAVHKQLKFHGW